MLLYTSVIVALLVKYCCSLTTEVVSANDVTCDEHLTLNLSVTISSPGYPYDMYSPGFTRTWCVSSPEHTTITLLCEHLEIPKSAGCKDSAIIVSSDKDEPRSHCGSSPFYFSSLSNHITFNFYSISNSIGGRFICQVVSEEVGVGSNDVRALEYDSCDCGYSYKTRIVGGTETGVNEFPFMAGLVDRRRGPIVLCGATIISRRFTLTAEHCLETITPTVTAVLVGEHNIATSSDTSATKLIRAKQFILYPYYDSTTIQYDIALVELVSPVEYSLRVGPICLPFMSQDWDLTGQYITVLESQSNKQPLYIRQHVLTLGGWGTTEFGGPRSTVLRKAILDVVDITRCINTYGYNVDPNTQLCTYRRNADACQYDSGGPLIWLNSATSHYEVVGLISYGRGCAAPGIPSVNTKVAPFLQWILDKTPGEAYCSNPNL